MTDLTPGKRLRSTVSDTEIIVVRSPSAPVELSCGGQPMTANRAAADADVSTAENDTVLGKRYVDTDTGLKCCAPRQDRACSAPTDGSRRAGLARGEHSG